MNITRIHPISHPFQVIEQHWSDFRFRVGYLSLTHSFCENITINHIFLKTGFLGLLFVEDGMRLLQLLELALEAAEIAEIMQNNGNYTI